MVKPNIEIFLVYANIVFCSSSEISQILIPSDSKKDFFVADILRFANTSGWLQKPTNLVNFRKYIRSLIIQIAFNVQLHP